MVSVTTPPEINCAGWLGINRDYWDYWCTLLANARGIELILNNTLTDIAWFLAEPGLGLDAVVGVLEDSGIEDYVEAVVLTNGLVILALRNPNPPYKPVEALGMHECHAPSKDSYYAWTKVASEILTILGINEVVKQAYRAWRCKTQQ